MYRILLVEDDAALADAITQVLTAWGHEVQKVRDFRHVRSSPSGSRRSY